MSSYEDMQRLRGASHYSCGIKRILDKLPTRGQGRSPLKYINCRLWIILERKVCLVEEKLSAIFMEIQTLLKWTNFWCQNFQKMLSCRHFGSPCLLAYSMKAKRTNFGSLLIKLLEFLVHSSDSCCVKYPLL